MKTQRARLNFTASKKSTGSDQGWIHSFFFLIFKFKFKFKFIDFEKIKFKFKFIDFAKVEFKFKFINNL